MVLLPSGTILLRVAVLLFPRVISLDYQGPIEMLGFLDPSGPATLPSVPKYSLDFTYVAPSLEPVRPIAGPPVLPDATYEGLLASGDQFDVLFVPGGPGARPNVLPPIVRDFVGAQAPAIRRNRNGFILSTCTGAWILADCGLLNGKNATTNKNAFKTIRNATDPSINWIAKARWVKEDRGKLWTSSGVTAGQDMAAAFFEHLNGRELATWVRGIIELSVREQGDDEFAEYYGLV